MMIHASTNPVPSSDNMGITAALEEPANTTVAGNDDDLKQLTEDVDKMTAKVGTLEQKVQEVERFYSSIPKKQHNLKHKDKARPITPIKTPLVSGTPSDTMQDLMSQFAKIFNQLIQKKGTRSSQEFVDAKDLGLHNCRELNGMPRDFSAIKKRMESKDGAGYSHVREIYTDVRTVLKNAMKFNDEKSDAHSTAKTLLERFSERWYLLLPKVMQEDEKAEEEQALQQANHVRMAKDIRGELVDVEEHLEKLKENVLQKCGKMSTLEKLELARAVGKLSPEHLNQALEIVAQNNPDFPVDAEELDLDLDSQSESTLRRLKYFILEVQKARANPTGVDGDKTDNGVNINAEKPHNANIKRKREILDASVKPTKKKTKLHGY